MVSEWLIQDPGDPRRRRQSGAAWQSPCFSASAPDPNNSDIGSEKELNDQPGTQLREDPPNPHPSVSGMGCGR